MLRQFCRPDIGHDQRGAGFQQRSVEAAQDVKAPGGFDADDDPVGLECIVDGHPLPKEFGVGRHVEPEALALSLEGGSDPVCRPGGNRRFLDHDDIVPPVAGDLTRGLLHRHEVRLAVGARGCPHADEYDLRIREGTRRIDREPQSTGRGLGVHRLFEPSFIERADPPSEEVDLLGVDVRSDDVVPDTGEGHAGDQSHVPGSDHGDLQGDPSICGELRLTQELGRPARAVRCLRPSTYP